jgi:hypothetical protein
MQPVCSRPARSSRRHVRGPPGPVDYLKGRKDGKEPSGRKAYPAPVQKALRDRSAPKAHRASRVTNDQRFLPASAAKPCQTAGASRPARTKGDPGPAATFRVVTGTGSVSCGDDDLLVCDSIAIERCPLRAPEDQKACSGDARRHCRAMLDQGDMAVLACLRQQQRKLTRKCPGGATEASAVIQSFRATIWRRWD